MNANIESQLAMQKPAAPPSIIGALHGWAMHSGLLDELGDCLPEVDWRGIDLPGHGRRRGRPWPSPADGAPADALPPPAALLNLLVGDLPQGSWLLGWSLGGLLAMQAVLEWPEQFSGLILISASPSLTRRPHWPDGVEPALLKAMALELAGRPEMVFSRFLALETHGSAQAKDELRRLKALAMAHGLPDSGALLAGLKHLAETDISARLAEIRIPTLIIGGRRDKLVPWRSLEQLDAQLPNSRLERIHGAAHAPFLTDPQAVAATIREFMTRV
ncbi:MAG: alpha/beta fold hydrolase [Wenzhouxiangellaceae bacterium]|nr:alpha/beta fold hydrolase [Wenzhouxiangellaceae bacterium]